METRDRESSKIDWLISHLIPLFNCSVKIVMIMLSSSRDIFITKDRSELDLYRYSITDNMSSLSDAAEKRKERLAILKSSKRKRDEEIVSAVTGDEDGEDGNKHMRYRNYDPKIQTAKMGYLQTPEQLGQVQTVEERAAELAEETRAQQNDLINGEAIDVQTLRPNDPNSDLKRGLQNKLDRLKAKQQKVVLEIVRERVRTLKEQGKNQAASNIEEYRLTSGAESM